MKTNRLLSLLTAMFVLATLFSCGSKQPDYGTNVTLTLKQESAVAEQKRDSLELIVYCNAEMTIKTDVDWIKQYKPEQGTANTYYFALETNMLTTDRQGTITFTSGAVSKSVGIKQKGGEWFELLAADRLFVSAEQQSGELSYITNVDVSTSLSNNAEWVTIGTKSEKVVDGVPVYTLPLTFGNNATQEWRTTNVVFSLSGGNKQNVEIVQVDKDSKWVLGDFYRKSLGMKFTATWCKYCPLMNDALAATHTLIPDRLEELVLHTHDSSSKLRYANTSVFASAFGMTGVPLLVIDKRLSVGASYQTATVGQMIASTVEELRTALKSNCGIAINSRLNQAREYTVDVTVYTHKAGTYFLGLALTESNMVVKQQVLEVEDPNYVHNNVVRQYLSELNGDSITFENDNQKVTKTYTFVLDDSYIADNCKLVAYVLTERPAALPQTVNHVDYKAYDKTIVDNATSVELGKSTEVRTE